MRFRRMMPLAAALVLSLPGFAAAANTPADPTAAAGAIPGATVVSIRIADTRAALRDLWVGHIYWVRNVAIARIADNPAATRAAEGQVVANAQALAGAIEPYYGKAASERLFGLLASHWGAISEYLDATRAAKRADQDAATRKLTANAGEIATYLGGANPHLPVDSLRGLLTAHGAHHLQQIQQLQQQQYEQEAATWAAMKDHVYGIADALADGIARQFPEKFADHPAGTAGTSASSPGIGRGTTGIRNPLTSMHGAAPTEARSAR